MKVIGGATSTSTRHVLRTKFHRIFTKKWNDTEVGFRTIITNDNIVRMRFSFTRIRSFQLYTIMFSPVASFYIHLQRRFAQHRK